MAKPKFTVQSLSFSHKGHIPPKFTCEGENTSPSLVMSNVPDDTISFAIIMDDPDAPRGTFDHWIVWNVLPNEAIGEGSNPGVSGINGFGNIGYGGPCPPSGVHRYYFRVYALDTLLSLEPGSGKADLLEAMDDHILGEAELMGLYQKKNQNISR